MFSGLKKRSVAFTLIELLVVIAIIGLLATLSVLALQNARINSRDAKRLADVKQIRTALEMYYNDAGHYPTASEFSSGKIEYYSAGTGTSTYMMTIPSAPTPPDGDCSLSDNSYSYVPSADGSTYVLDFCIAKNNGDLPAGILEAHPAGISWVGQGGGDQGASLNPKHLASLTDGTGGAILVDASFVKILGNYAYVLSEANWSFEIVDISNPASPAHVGSLVDGSDNAVLNGASSLAISGNYVYVANKGGSSLEVINISDPANPTHVAVLHDGVGGANLNSANSIEIFGSYAYITSEGGNALEVVDISSPSNPTHAALIADGTGGATINNPVGLSISGSYAYVVSQGSNSLEVIDISNPLNPTHVSSLADNTGGAMLDWPADVVVSGGYAYVSSVGDDALEIVNVSNPANPTHAGSIVNGSGGASISDPYYIALTNDYVILSNNSGASLEIIDVSNPATPTHADLVSNGDYGALLSNPYAVDVSGDYVYATDRNSGALEIIDLYAPEEVVTVTFNKVYSGTNLEITHPVIAGSGYLGIGTISGYGAPINAGLILKTDNAGNELWRQGINTPDSMANFLRSGRVDSSGNIITCGQRFTVVSSTAKLYAWAYKTDPSGNQLWSYDYVMSPNSKFEKVELVSGGGYFLIGKTDVNGTSDGLAFKVDSNGNEIWSNILSSSSNNDGFDDAIATADGGVIAVGYANSTSTSPVGSLWAVKFDTSGNVVWNNTYAPLGLSEGESITTAPSGAYIISGFSADNGGNGLLLKIDSIGDEIWSKSFGGTDEDGFYGVIAVEDDDYLAVGGYDLQDMDPATGRKAWAVKVDSSGNQIWEKKIDLDTDFFHKTIFTPDNGYLISTTGGQMIKMDKNGNY